MGDDVLMIRISTELKQLLQKRAENEQRDMSKQVIYLIKKDLTDAGLISTSPAPTEQQQ